MFHTHLDWYVLVHTHFLFHKMVGFCLNRGRCKLNLVKCVIYRQTSVGNVFGCQNFDMFHVIVQGQYIVIM
jgi:hypothetical protein